VITNDRFATYAVGLGIMVLTGWAQIRDKMSWAYNWDLWSATRWSDIAPFQLDRVPLTLNRIAALGLAVFFIVVTLRFFARRGRDATRTADRLRTANLWRSVVSLTPWLAAPVTAIIVLAFMVHGGWQGGAARKKMHDYWKKNVLTYRAAPTPARRAGGSSSRSIRRRTA
jgi:succinate dehydrogenase/fumarate reductase cytochrome b subunit